MKRNFYSEDLNDDMEINEIDKALSSLKGKDYMMTKEEEEIILKMAKKYKHLG